MTNYDESHKIQNRNIVDLCCYCFGLALCFFLMYLLGNILYHVNWSNSVESYNAIFPVVGFILLTVAAAFGFFAIIEKVKMLV